MADHNRTKIVAFGDSITEGTYGGAGRRQVWTSVLERRLNAVGLDVDIINSGVPGETAPLGLQRFSYDVLAQKPQIVLIMYGANDSFMPFQGGQPAVSIHRFESALTEMVNLARAESIQPVMMTTTPVFLFEDPEFDQNVVLGDYMEAVHRITTRTGLQVIDHFAMWMRKGRKENLQDKFLPDGVHPNAEGNALIAETIHKHLENTFIR